MYELLAFFAISVASLGIATGLSSRRSFVLPVRLMLIAIGLRILGSTVRYEVLERYYSGVGDAGKYYDAGMIIARRMWDFDLAALGADAWFSGNWWGTRFLENVSGTVLTVIGPSMRAEFLVFSLLAFIGLYAMVAAMRIYHPGLDGTKYALWLWCWPTLWFWPSSVGKEALIMLAIGLFVYGYTLSEKARRRVFLLVGISLAFCIRPHVAAVLAFAMAIAHWIGSWQKFTLRQGAELVVAIVVAVVMFQGMAAQFGLEEADLEGMLEFAQSRAQGTLRGGSNIGAAPITGSGLPLAFVNVWLRPFPFEAHNMTALIASFEVVLFWFLAWRERRSIAYAWKHWREHKLLRFAVPFVLGYTLMIGATFGNLGIIARQRTPLFPFAFMFILAASGMVAARGSGTTPALRPPNRTERAAAARVRP